MPDRPSSSPDLRTTEVRSDGSIRLALGRRNTGCRAPELAWLGSGERPSWLPPSVSAMDVANGVVYVIERVCQGSEAVGSTLSAYGPDGRRTLATDLESDVIDLQVVASPGVFMVGLLHSGLGGDLWEYLLSPSARPDDNSSLAAASLECGDGSASFPNLPPILSNDHAVIVRRCGTRLSALRISSSDRSEVMGDDVEGLLFLSISSDGTHAIVAAVGGPMWTESKNMVIDVSAMKVVAQLPRISIIASTFVEQEVA